jgi:CelD/BcsL family acetyltransferase involved in cellulose biosynthesis
VRELVVEEINKADALEIMRPEWQALLDAAGAPPFLSWEWLSAWQEVFGHDRSLRLLRALDDGRLVGLLPLGVEDRRAPGLPLRLRRLFLLGEGEGGADYLEALALPGYELEVASAFIAHLEKDDSFDLLELDGLPTDSASLPLLTRYFADNLRFRLQILPRDLCPQIRIDDWEDVLRQSQRVSYFNRSAKRLRKLPGYEFRVITDAEQLSNAFERFLKLHEMSWVSRGGSGATGTPEQKAFLREVMKRMASTGWLRFEEVWIEGECRASLLGLESGERFYFFLNGYDPAWSKYSLGFTILWLSIESAAQRGIKLYDLLRGSEAYKFFWANSARATVTARVLSRSLPAKLFLAREQIAMLGRILLPEWTRSIHQRLHGEGAPEQAAGDKEGVTSEPATVTGERTGASKAPNSAPGNERSYAK